MKNLSLERLWVSLIDSPAFRRFERQGMGAQLFRSRFFQQASQLKNRLSTTLAVRSQPDLFRDVHTFVLFIGHNKSGTSLVGALLDALDAEARRRGAILLKIEPGLGLDGADFARLGFRPSPQTIQPPRTIVLDLSGDDEAILARMNQGTRRNIRKSARFEVAIRQGTRDDVPRFNALLAETGDRNEFGVHAPDYYQRAYDLFAPEGRAALTLGSYGGQDLAGVMVFRLGDWAWYFYGASSDRERQRMASYGVQWAGIQWAKAGGARYYDLYGVHDAGPQELEAQFEARSDGLWGVYRFKRGWGGDVLRGAGAWDRVYRPAIYAAYRLAVRLLRRAE